MSFLPLSLTEFNFLITTYNFHLLDPSRTIFEAEYQKGPLSITFISGKGEIDIDFWVSLPSLCRSPGNFPRLLR